MGDIWNKWNLSENILIGLGIKEEFEKKIESRIREMHSAYITLSNVLLWKYSTLNFLWNGILWREILLDVRPEKEDQECLNNPDHLIIFVPTLDFFIFILKSNTVHTEQKCVT